jgi:hypothetical protein
VRTLQYITFILCCAVAVCLLLVGWGMLTDPNYTTSPRRRNLIGIGMMLLAIPVVTLGLDYYYG